MQKSRKYLIFLPCFLSETKLTQKNIDAILLGELSNLDETEEYFMKKVEDYVEVFRISRNRVLFSEM